jgi:hypothetical protein
MRRLDENANETLHVTYSRGVASEIQAVWLNPHTMASSQTRATISASISRKSAVSDFRVMAWSNGAQPIVRAEI